MKLFFNKAYKTGVVLIAIAIASCQQKDDNVSPKKGDSYTTEVNAGLYELMKEWYLWNDKLPASFNPASYNTPEDALEALTYKALDSWSFIQDTVAFSQYFDEGKVTGYGFGMKLDADNNLKVTFVYNNSPMARQNVTRGYKILKVNGTNVQTLINNNTLFAALGENKAGAQATFEVEDLTGNKRTFTLAKEEVKINTVLQAEVKEVAGKKVGYIVFNTFIEKSKAELDQAFAKLQSEGASELVLDLRYNGGGSLDVANHLASLIGGGQTVDKEFVELTYNTKKQGENFPIKFETSPYDLHLDKLFVITTRSSASASEAVINGLKPYLPVFTIGDDSHGKPVGMNIFTIGKYAVAPITFKLANSLGQADYFEGIKATVYATDNLNYLLGDERENCLRQALHYIQFSAFDGTNARHIRPAYNKLVLKGFSAETGML